MPACFWCPDPAAAAMACRKLHPDAVQRTIAIAEDVCRHRFLFRDHWEMERTHRPVQFGPAVQDIDWAHIPAGDPEWLYAMNRHSCFVNLGKAWQYTGSARYAQEFADLIESWIDRVPLTEQSSAGTWRSLEAGLRCETWLRALGLFAGSPALSPELCAKINACLLVHGGYLAKASGEFHLLSNWGVLQDHGLFLLGLYFGQPEWQALALQRMAGNLHRAVMRDGTHWEQSPLYHCEVLHCAMDAVLIARQNGVTLPDGLQDTVHRMCTALAAWLKPDGRLVCQSDSDDTDARDLLALGAVLFADGQLRAAAGSTLFEENFWDLGAEQWAAYAALAPDPSALGSAVLPDSGNVMFRGPGGAWAHMHCGCLGSGHGHADLLHLDAGIAGEDVLIDAGRYTYMDTPLRRQLKLPAAHNTTRLDGTDFSQCAGSWGYERLAVPLKGEHCFTPAADFASGLHLGYLDRGVAAARKLVFLRGLGLVVIFDQFFGKGRHLCEQNFHFGPGRAVRDGNAVLWQGQQAAARLLCLGPGLSLSMSRQPYSRDYNALEEGDALQVRRTCEDFGWFITVLSMDGSPGDPLPVEASLLPVHRLRLQTPLSASEAQAVRLRKNGWETVLLACHGEVISEVDLLAAGGYAGYGKMLVFDEAHPLGLCLAW